MSSLAVMQPYFFPYIGYFQLIHEVDNFIFYDDVDFIKNGWINRNRILINGEANYITIPCKNVSSFKPINNIEHNLDLKSKKKLLKKIQFTYQNASQFDKIYGIIEEVIMLDTNFVGEIARESVVQISEYLELECVFYNSSDLTNDKTASAANRLIDMCNLIGSDRYVNPLGGKELYDKAYFCDKGIDLQFIESKMIEYKQFKNSFVANLSIIDVCMFNPIEEIKAKLLSNYKVT